MDVLEAVIQYIVQKRVCLAKDTDIFKSYIPDDQNNIVSLHEPISYNYNSYTGMNTRRVQILVRNLSIREATKKCWDIFHLFDGEEEAVVINGVTIPFVIKSTPSKKYSDDKGRHHVQFDINFVVNNRK